MAGVGADPSIVFLGLARGQRFDEMFLLGISLAIAAIPTGMPGRRDDAAARSGRRRSPTQGAIVKRLRSVETLGVDVGDLLGQDRHADAEPDDRARSSSSVGRRYSTSKARATRPTDGSSRVAGERRHAASSRSCCRWRSANDAAVRDGEHRRRPDRGARSCVLAAKGGLDVVETAAAYPRVAEVPFDSDYKFMATFHEMQDDGRRSFAASSRARPTSLLARAPRSSRRRRRSSR